MDIGKKLYQARLDAGLSQRQLCGDVITRNMLSLIENGSARPSMDTLSYLAERLGKPISYFLEENTRPPNAACMEQARRAYVQGQLEAAEAFLQTYQPPDEDFDDAFGLLTVLILLARAEQALDRPIHARELLEKAKCAAEATCYSIPELEERRLWLLAQACQEPVTLPGDDRKWHYRAKQALVQGDIRRCVAWLEVCRDRESPQWHFLRGEAALKQEEYAQAAEHYHLAEPEMPRDCWPKLEQCYQALKNYKMAYEYACKQR